MGVNFVSCTLRGLGAVETPAALMWCILRAHRKRTRTRAPRLLKRPPRGRRWRRSSENWKCARCWSALRWEKRMLSTTLPHLKSVSEASTISAWLWTAAESLARRFVFFIGKISACDTAALFRLDQSGVTVDAGHNGNKHESHVITEVSLLGGYASFQLSCIL